MNAPRRNPGITLADLPIEVDPEMPDDEVQLVDGKGRVLVRIVGIEIPRGPRFAQDDEGL